MQVNISQLKSSLTVAEFLTIYSISRATFYSEVKKKRIKIKKLGKRTFILCKDAEIWLGALEDGE